MAQPWPGMARTIHNNHQRFIDTYFQPYPGTVLRVQEQTASVFLMSVFTEREMYSL